MHTSFTSNGIFNSIVRMQELLDVDYRVLSCTDQSTVEKAISNECYIIYNHVDQRYCHSVGHIMGLVGLI